MTSLIPIVCDYFKQLDELILSITIFAKRKNRLTDINN